MLEIVRIRLPGMQCDVTNIRRLLLQRGSVFHSHEFPHHSCLHRKTLLRVGGFAPTIAPGVIYRSLAKVLFAEPLEMSIQGLAHLPLTVVQAQTQKGRITGEWSAASSYRRQITELLITADDRANRQQSGRV